MNLAKFFGFGRSNQEPGLELQDQPLLDINLAARFLQDARGCLNDHDGPKFVNGIRIAFEPMRQRVADQTGKNLEFGDAVQQYALFTREEPEVPLRTLINLATRLEHASACGVRFMAAELISAYVSVGAYKGGNIAEVLIRDLQLSEQSIEILETGAKYG